MSEPIFIELSGETRRNLDRIAAKEGVEFEEAIDWALRAGLHALRAESRSGRDAKASWGDLGTQGGGEQ